MASSSLRSLAIVISLMILATARAQGPDTPGKPPYEFYSGSVVEITAEKISVLRDVPGQASGTRTFVITPQTRIEGKPRVKARVTVAYTDEDGSGIAVRIIVRPPQKKAGAGKPVKKSAVEGERHSPFAA